MKARIVYKNKSGWKIGKHGYVKGTLEALTEYATKEARGREFQIQEIKAENIPSHWTDAMFFEV